MCQWPCFSLFPVSDPVEVPSHTDSRLGHVTYFHKWNKSKLDTSRDLKRLLCFSAPSIYPLPSPGENGSMWERHMHGGPSGLDNSQLTSSWVQVHASAVDCQLSLNMRPPGSLNHQPIDTWATNACCCSKFCGCYSAFFVAMPPWSSWCFSLCFGTTDMKESFVENNYIE